ncbi:Tryptophan-associated transmembrane protein (Trp_oprn_chp) [Micromonospora pallida]|uniref:Tryptophan-associated transmembrane protein (Trp_oprn_chp) n=1 Tax=Micromonospora pallida TaxID=145854 RepID=A0A1C6RN76_9ACTN|nr:Trp biosynthesis-associated membrane protein [Micromonospora pallida]SCL18640.1 Tryptophan-associated transmembrane protein (Trp_oprn_chp) [Micromonospora pallida]
MSVGAGRPAGGGGVSSAGRRELTYAVLLCLAGAGLAVWAATRTWAVELTPRPAPLPALREARSGAALLPWLPALAVVALAGAGAVLATRGALRRLVGMLILLLGVAVAAGGGYALGAGFEGEVSRQWPALCLLGGVLATAGGAWTVLRGAAWPAMGARYERPARGAAGTPDEAGSAGAAARTQGRTADAWDALDRGEDPTVS